MRTQIRNSIILAVLLVAAAPAGAQTRLVNMIPQSRSGETNQDAEPTLTVDLNDYSRIVGSAFTWDNLTGSPMVTATAPIFVSLDRGATWTPSLIVPSKVGSGFPTGDINVGFSGVLSGAAAHETSWFYAGTLSSTVSTRPMTVLRAQDPFSATVMTTLDTRTGNVDQPHLRVLSSLSGTVGQDRLYVGFNNGYSCVMPNGRTSTIDASQNASIAAPALALDVIEARNTACQDGFAQVPAPHLDGTVYAAFIHDWSSSPRLVVVRDDNWAAGGSPFTALTDPSDSTAGRYVTAAMTLPSGTMGQNRLGASNVSIAVDPRNSDRVYVAWGDSGGSNLETIHVRRSINRGVAWSTSDLLTVTSAMNPEIAINARGTVGVLYQRVVSSKWETHLVRTTDADATTFDTPGILLASQSATTPVAVYSPYIGDYASLIAAGKNFMGMFSTSNYPDTANFVAGVQYQRYVDWGTHTLYANAAHTTAVSPSIDPFFFEVDTVAPANDFYVRDWTTDATHADTGVEPSTYPYFYTNPDVWNRRSTSPGPFTSDQPSNEDAGNGAGNIGDNWAFVRVRRNATGTATPVTAHFLVSRFGTGSNYVDATTGDPNVTFPDPDPVIAADTTQGPWISSAYHWHLNATSGNHLCLAVQISTAADPYIPPTLAGATPGWSTGTDLRVVNDNNKAQRNMHLTTLPAEGSGTVTEWAIVHNAGLLRRDIPLRVVVEGASRKFVRKATMRPIGPEKPVTVTEKAPQGEVVLRGLEPGDNRWVEVTLEVSGLPSGATAYANVQELVGNKPVGGFGVGMRAVPAERVHVENLEAYRSAVMRLGAGFNVPVDPRDEADFRTFAKMAPAEHVAFVRDRALPRLKGALDKAKLLSPNDPFRIQAAITAVSAAKDPVAVTTAHATLLNAIDSQLTMRQLERGDPADIVQMVRWQKQLFRQAPALARLSCAAGVVEASSEFLAGRETGKLTNAAYPQHLGRVRDCL
ncbi:MAG: hypothetical protein E6J91_46445, partial [Deltaproteobacteria bacterium]